MIEMIQGDRMSQRRDPDALQNYLRKVEKCHTLSIPLTILQQYSADWIGLMLSILLLRQQQIFFIIRLLLTRNHTESTNSNRLGYNSTWLILKRTLANTILQMMMQVALKRARRRESVLDCRRQWGMVLSTIIDSSILTCFQWTCRKLFLRIPIPTQENTQTTKSKIFQLILMGVCVRLGPPAAPEPNGSRAYTRVPWCVPGLSRLCRISVWL